LSGSLTFLGVTCVRGGRALFEELSFALAPGGAALVTGSNGVGKSSLIRIAAGLLRPHAGSVEGSGGRALMAEAAGFDLARRLRDALLFWAKLDDSPDPARRVANGLQATGLAALADIPVRLLSTGQRRRAALARVVASEAPVWLLDEPANGLDTASLAQLTLLLAAHRASGGVVLVASHTPVDLPGARVIALEPMA
jgi:heme exporter protein A